MNERIWALPDLKERTCRACREPFRSIIARKRHEKKFHPDLPDKLLYDTPEERDTAVLKTIGAMTRMIEQGPFTDDLADAMNLKRPTADTIVARLKERGFVTNSRAQGLMLTDAGRRRVG
jgi:hypothetical protein